MTNGVLQDRTLRRLGELGAQDGFYTHTEVQTALNEAQRLLVLLTLCLETSGTLPLSEGEAWYQPLQMFPDFILPLAVRVAGTGGARLSPKRLQDLDAINEEWQDDPGTPRRYACLGFDLMAVHRQPASSGTSLSIVYAKSPSPLTASGQEPDVPEEYHPTLIDYAIPRLRVKEGAQEFQKTLWMVERFFADARKLNAFIRARNKAQRYDRLPPEFTLFDRSKLFEFVRKKSWPTMLDSRPAAEPLLQPTM